MWSSKDWFDVLFKSFIIGFVVLFAYGMGSVTTHNELLTNYCKSKSGSYETIKGKKSCLIDNRVEEIEWMNEDE